MSKLEIQISELIKKENLFSYEDKLLIGLSGGLDSICLLLLFHKLGYKVEAAHLNYQLRGTESDEDERFVKDFCKKKEIIIHSTRVAIESKKNLQAEARRIRYEFFNELKITHEFDYILTAHHQQDQVETVFLNFLRGSGVKGLGGMDIKKGSLIRPFLLTSKEAIIEYGKEQGLEYREDSSNSTSDYQRNYLRNRIIPLLKEKFPGLSTRIVNSAENFGKTSAWVEEEIKKTIDSLQKNNELLKKSELLSHPMRSYILQNILHPFNFSTALIRDIDKKIQYAETGKKYYNNNHTHTLIVGREYLKLCRPTSAPDKLTPHSLIDIINYFQLFGIHINVDVKGAENRLPIELFYLNESTLLNDQLEISSSQSGDKIKVDKQLKKITVNKFLSDFKLEPWEKDLIPLLKISGEIVWIPGYWISKDHKQLSKNENVSLLTIDKK